MSQASERLNNVLLDLPKYQAQWQVAVASPYVRAYDVAFQKFQDTMKKQEDHNKMIAELFVLSASILTGSVMMAAFATASLRVLAGRAALEVVCRNNLYTTFNAMHAISSSKSAMFALGGILDEAKKVAGKQIEAAALKLSKSTDIASSSSAINLLTQVNDFINTNQISLHEATTSVRDSSAIPDASKLKFAELIRKAPFCNPPTGNRVNEIKLAEKMELLFYMSAVLDSDELVTSIPDAMPNPDGIGPSRSEVSRKSISQMPSAKDYPKASNGPIGRWPNYNPQTEIRYRDIGAEVRDRIDTLNKSVNGASFFGHAGILERMQFVNPTKAEHLRKAEQISYTLSVDARPRNMLDVRVM